MRELDSILRSGVNAQSFFFHRGQWIYGLIKPPPKKPTSGLLVPLFYSRCIPYLCLICVYVYWSCLCTLQRDFSCHYRDGQEISYIFMIKTTITLTANIILMTNIGSDKPNNYDNDPVKSNYAENDDSNIMINIIRSN